MRRASKLSAWSILNRKSQCFVTVNTSVERPPSGTHIKSEHALSVKTGSRHTIARTNGVDSLLYGDPQRLIIHLNSTISQHRSSFITCLCGKVIIPWLGSNIYLAIGGGLFIHKTVRDHKYKWQQREIETQQTTYNRTVKDNGAIVRFWWFCSIQANQTPVCAWSYISLHTTYRVGVLNSYFKRQTSFFQNSS